MQRLAIAALIVFAAVAIPGGAMAAPACFGQAATIAGTGTITGTPGDDVIAGSRLDDQIDGMGGNDVICGSGGNDSIESGRGLVQPGGVVVWFDGGSGNDMLIGPEWAIETHAFGRTGADQIYDNAGWLSATGELVGGDGDDFIVFDGPSNAAAKSVAASGGPGNDRVIFRANSEAPSVATMNATVDGGDGDDRIEGDESANFAPSLVASFVLLGGVGNDLIQGVMLGTYGTATTITNAISGGEGDDELFAGDGVSVTNRIDGGSHTAGDNCYAGPSSRDRFRRCELIV